MRRLGVIILAVLFCKVPTAWSQELPIWMTEEEKELQHLIGKGHRSTPPPHGTVRVPAEWERMDGVLFRWPRWLSIWESIYREMVDAVVARGKAYIIVGSSSEQSNVENYLQSGGVSLDSVVFVILPTNSVWIRDYGPWYTYVEGDELSIVDLIYNRPRPQDDSIPMKLANLWGDPLYAPDLTHVGGNFMVDGRGTGFSTDLIYEENPGMTEEEIDSVMLYYLGVEQFVVVPRIYYEYTGHIDIFAKVLNDTLVMVGEYEDPSDPNYGRLNEIADSISSVVNADGIPFRVVRMIMPVSLDPWTNTGPTYLNSLMFNGMVMVPTYGLPTDTTALRIYSEILPDYDIVGIDCSVMVGFGGAVHCLTIGVGIEDTIPPIISHTPLSDQPLNEWPTSVLCSVSDESIIRSVILVYMVNDSLCEPINMEKENTLYSASFTAPVEVGDSVFYRIEAQDGAFNTDIIPKVGWFGFEITPPAGLTESRMDMDWRLQVSPNPFSHTTVIKIEGVTRRQGDGENNVSVFPCPRVALSIYDLSGRLIRRFTNYQSTIDNHQSPINQIVWDGKDCFGRAVPSGVYMIKGSHTKEATKVVLVR